MSARAAILGFGLIVLASMQTQAAEVDAASPNPLHALDKSSLKSFVEAPLFDPARRLPPPVPVFVPMQQPVVATEQPPPNLRLIGVIHGKRDVAVVHRADSQKTEMISTGDQVGSWQVTVMAIGIRLTNGARAYDYALFSKGGAAPGPIPAPPPSDPPQRPRAITEMR